MKKIETYADKAALMSRFMSRDAILAAADYCDSIADEYPRDHPMRADKIARANAFRAAVGDPS